MLKSFRPPASAVPRGLESQCLLKTTRRVAIICGRRGELAGPAGLDWRCRAVACEPHEPVRRHTVSQPLLLPANHQPWTLETRIQMQSSTEKPTAGSGLKGGKKQSPHPPVDPGSRSSHDPSLRQTSAVYHRNPSRNITPQLKPGKEHTHRDTMP